MKKIVLLILMALLIIPAARAQVPTMSEKEYKKAIKKRTKDAEKEGWRPVGSGTLAMYIQRGMEKEFAENEDGEQTYIVVYGEANGGAYDAVSEDAWSGAKVKIAGNMEAYITGLIKREVANEKITLENAETISKYLGASKQIIAQKISVKDIYFLKKDLPGGMIMVKYAGYYDSKMAKHLAQEELKKQLEEEAGDVSKELDEMFKTN